MSVRVMSRVWDYSRARGNTRLVLLAIADCANDAGTNAYPSVDRLSAKCQVDRRTIQRSIKELEKIGELVVDRNTGRGNASEYKITVTESDVKGRQFVHEPEIKGGNLSDKGRQSDQKGRQSDQERAAQCRTNHNNNHQEPSEEPSIGEPPPKKPIELILPKDFDISKVPKQLLNSDEFSNAWNKWVHFRKNDLHKPLKKTSVEQQMEFLADQENPVEVIKQSIRQGWTGLFELKNVTNGTARQSQGSLSEQRASFTADSAFWRDLNDYGT